MHLTLLIVSLISLFQQRLDSYIFLIISSVKYPLCRSAHPILLWLLASQPGFGPGVQQFDLAPRACKLSRILDWVLTMNQAQCLHHRGAHFIEHSSVTMQAILWAAEMWTRYFNTQKCYFHTSLRCWIP